MLSIARRRNWRIQNERCLTALGRRPRCRAQTRTPHSPELLGRQRLHSTRGDPPETGDPSRSTRGPAGDSVQAQGTPAVRTLYSAVCLLVGAAGEANEAPSSKSGLLAHKLEVTSFFFHGAEPLVHEVFHK